jgi:Copper binding proteins, plastocyanin/azurin family
MSAKGSSAVGIVVAILIVGAVATIGYYQVGVAPYISTSTTSATAAPVNCAATPSSCIQVTIVPGAYVSYPGYTAGSTKLYGYNVTGTPDNSFTVVIGVNNTVFWTNNDSAIHTVTSDTGDPASFDSGCIASNSTPCPGSSAGITFQYTFTTPGTYGYHCDYHNWMHGKVVVLAGTGSTSSSSSTVTTSSGTTGANTTSTSAATSTT